MKFRTEIMLPAFKFSISHADSILMMGSCFVENMATPLRDSGFQIDVNPFGTIYNPQSLSTCIRELLTDKKYSVSDLFEYQGLYRSFSHHSRFSDPSPEGCLQKINDRLLFSSEFLKEKANLFIITFGTSFVYLLKLTRQTVANCHKLPDNRFIRKRLCIEKIVEDWNRLIQEIRTMNPGIRFLFTVSPIRHRKDGAHENQLSKSILLLSIDEIIRQNEGCYYFPSYELLLDDLRDYRFYADDMIHPSPVAVDYIWEKFSDAFFSLQTKQRNVEWQNIQKAVRHKPFNPDSEEYKAFLKKTEERLEVYGTQ